MNTRPQSSASTKFLLVNEQLRAQVEAWIRDEVDESAARELQMLLQAGDEAELADRFRAPLTFGTAGLRGPLRAGPNGMNRTVVRRAAAGVASWLAASGHGSDAVVVGYDARHGSADFARDSVMILAGAGFAARLMPRPLPTPVLAYAVQQLGAAAGIMVTASHNPPQDNGYKVYADDGAQIIPPADAQIEAAIQAAGPTHMLPMSERFEVLDEGIVEQYAAAVAALIPDGPRELRVVHTALHGVSTEIVRRSFETAGFAAPIPVPQQADADPDFRTVAFPNPEEPGALDLALDVARAHDAELVIANDPDADRCAVAVPTGQEWRTLRGDELGALLADWLLRRDVRGTYATTIVSSSLLGAMAQRHGVGYAETLTGFKWITRAAPDLVYGYEEALGYAVAPNLVRDKDGISASLLAAALAAQLKVHGSSLTQRLDEIAAEYGRHATDQISIRVDDLLVIAGIMRRLRARPPDRLLGQAVQITDLLPAADVLRLSWSRGKVVVRPSGTEPKLKVYLEVIVPDGSAVKAAEQLAELRREVGELVAPQ